MKKLTIVYLIVNVLFLAAVCAFIHQYKDENRLENWAQWKNESRGYVFSSPATITAK